MNVKFISAKQAKNRCFFWLYCKNILLCTELWTSNLSVPNRQKTGAFFGCTVRIYYFARNYERQIYQCQTDKKQVHAVGCTIRIYYFARTCERQIYQCQTGKKQVHLYKNILGCTDLWTSNVAIRVQLVYERSVQTVNISKAMWQTMYWLKVCAAVQNS